jgi:hypothetical protein
MADRLVIHVDGERAALLEIAASVLDIPVADYVMSILDRAIAEAPFRFVDPDPAIDRAILDEAKRTGNTVPWPEVRDQLLRRHTDDTANTP